MSADPGDAIGDVLAQDGVPFRRVHRGIASLEHALAHGRIQESFGHDVHGLVEQLFGVYGEAAKCQRRSSGRRVDEQVHVAVRVVVAASH